MRKIVLTSAAMLSALLFATIAATMPVEREAGVSDPAHSGYGVFASHAGQRQ